MKEQPVSNHFPLGDFWYCFS